MTSHPGNLTPGSLVRLKSGGPSMTVESIDEKGLVHCVWFPLNKGQPVTRAFAQDILEQVAARATRVHVHQSGHSPF